MTETNPLFMPFESLKRKNLINTEDEGFVNALVEEAIADCEAKGETLPTVIRLNPDDVWLAHAVAFYDNAPKHPVSNQIHRDTASRILGMLLQVEEKENLQKLAAASVDGSMSDCRSVMSQLARIVCKRKGIPVIFIN